jgi:serine phosphatase RsbU (regulator of sigma subunit)
MASFDCAVAGHLPILRMREGIVEEVTSPQLAFGVLDDATFDSCRVESRPGALFAVLIDGLVELFDGDRQELGFEWAKEVRRAASRSRYCRSVDSRSAPARRADGRPGAPVDSPHQGPT